MRTFILRARAAPTDSQRLRDNVNGEAHSEILAHALMNSLFVAQSHRADVVVHLVLESTRDYSRTITFNSNELRDIGGFDEASLLNTICQALDASVGMGKDETRLAGPGIIVQTLSFEKLIARLSESMSLFVMDKKGDNIRETSFDGDAGFILTDHIPMPKKSFHTLKRFGVEKLSLGPTMLFASQCITLIHNELDLRPA